MFTYIPSPCKSVPTSNFWFNFVYRIKVYFIEHPPWSEPHIANWGALMECWEAQCQVLCISKNQKNFVLRFTDRWLCWSEKCMVNIACVLAKVSEHVTWSVRHHSYNCTIMSINCSCLPVSPQVWIHIGRKPGTLPLHCECLLAAPSQVEYRRCGFLLHFMYTVLSQSKQAPKVGGAQGSYISE